MRKNSECGVTSQKIGNLIKYYKDEIMTNGEIMKLKALDKRNVIIMKKTEEEYPLKFHTKTFFVDDKIMNEDEFHKYKETINPHLHHSHCYSSNSHYI